MIQIDMEKPNHCLYCPMCNGDDECVLIQEIDTSWDWEEQYANCPLQEVEPECKKGKWIDYTDEGFVECPFCHSATNCDGNKDELHYCFSCGAELRCDSDDD